MFITEFASSLDLMGIFTHSVGDELGLLSAEYGTKFVSKIRRKKDGAFRIVNVPKNGSMTDQEIEALGKMGAYDGFGWHILDEKFDPEYLEFFNALISIPSVVIDSVITTGGVERIYFRAHETDRTKIRDLAYGGKPKPDSMFIEKLDWNPGLVEIMKKIDSEIPLSYLEFRMKVPPTAMEVEKDPVISTFGNNWIREVKYLMDENAYAIYYEKSKLLRANPNIIEISREENIFRMNYSNPVINSLVEQATSQNVGLLSLAQRMLGRDFYLSYIVPTMCLGRINSIMSDVINQYSNWEISLSSVKDLKSAQS